MAREVAAADDLEQDSRAYRERTLPEDIPELQAEVRRLAAERNAVILAHNYQVAEVQEVADVVGDSLALARAATRTDARVVVLCGVHFMAETAAILNPGRRVLIPDLAAGCSLADTIDAEQLRAWKAEHPGAVVVSYVNTTAEVKAESDYCCTSGNAQAVIEAIPEDREILFLPDLFLGTHLERLTGRRLHVWPGECHVHAGIRAADIKRAQAEHGDADLLIHPECGCTSFALYLGSAGDLDPARLRVLSTEGMVRHALDSPRRDFVVATEVGMLDRLRRDARAAGGVDKRFYAISERAVCRHMKRITLPKLARSLRQGVHEVTVPEPVAARARQALTRMVALG